MASDRLPENMEDNELMERGEKTILPDSILTEVSDKFKKKNGAITIDELLVALRNVYIVKGDHCPTNLEQQVRDMDTNRDGEIDLDEFRIAFREMPDLKQQFFERAMQLIKPNYTEHMDCKPPPIFMILISFVEVAVFVAYAIHQHHVYDFPTTTTSGAPLYSPLLYDPSRRYEAWRFITYMFIHNGIKHLVLNVIFQCVIGIPFEVVHKGLKVAVIYLSGVIAGSLGSSVFDPWTLLCGASGGVYALIGAQFANICLNWKEMNRNFLKGKRPSEIFFNSLISGYIQLAIWLTFATVDTGSAMYERFYAETDVRISFTAHFTGAIAGVLFGILFVKNIEWEDWEATLWWVVLFTSIILVVVPITYNCVLSDHYPPTDWRPCCPVPSHYVDDELSEP